MATRGRHDLYNDQVWKLAGRRVGILGRLSLVGQSADSKPRGHEEAASPGDVRGMGRYVVGANCGC